MSLNSCLQKVARLNVGQLLHHAAYRRHPAQADVLEYLVYKGIKVNDIMYQNRIDNYNMQKNWPLGTPLHRAAETGNLPGAKWLVEHGADPRIRDSMGQLPLNRAEAWDRPDVVQYLRPTTEAAPEPGSQWNDGRRGATPTPVPLDEIRLVRRQD